MSRLIGRNHDFIRSAQDSAAEAERRAEQTMAEVERKYRLDDIANSHQSRARALWIRLRALGTNTRG